MHSFRDRLIFNCVEQIVEVRQWDEANIVSLSHHLRVAQTRRPTLRLRFCHCPTPRCALSHPSGAESFRGNCKFMFISLCHTFGLRLSHPSSEGRGIHVICNRTKFQSYLFVRFHLKFLHLKGNPCITMFQKFSVSLCETDLTVGNR